MQAWEQFVVSVERELGKETTDHWLRTLRIKRFDAGNIYLEAKDTFQILWFEEHIRQRALKRLLTNSQKPIKVHIQLMEGQTAPSSRRKARPAPIKTPPNVARYAFDALDPSCTFDALMPHQGNLLALKIIHQLLGYDEKTNRYDPTLVHSPEFNPIFLYGPSGSGKTHLLMATAQVLLSAGIKTIYSRAETFTEHLVSAIRMGNMSQFRDVWRSCDVLLMDDIDIFSKKVATQEEFFHTFNTLHLAGKQIILTSSTPPQDLTHVEPRLISRFEWGIVTPLHCPPPTKMSALLKKKEEALNFTIPAKVASYLIDTFRSSPKSLMEAFSALILRLHLDKKNSTQSLHQITSQTLSKLLSDLIEKEQRSTITPDKVIQIVAEQYGIRVEDILGLAKSRDCVLPRQLAMHLCRTLLKLPYTKIGDQFGRDHSTVMSSIKQIQKEIDAQNSDLLSSLHAISRKIQI